MKKMLVAALLVMLFFVPVVAESENSNAVRIDLLKTTTTWNGAEMPPYPEEQPEITIFKGIIPPGAMSSIHKHPTIGAFVILKGVLTIVTKDNDVVYVKAGEAYAEVINEWHYGINEGTETVELIFFHAGAVGIPNAIAESDSSDDEDDDEDDVEDDVEEDVDSDDGNGDDGDNACRRLKRLRRLCRTEAIMPSPCLCLNGVIDACERERGMK